MTWLNLVNVGTTATDSGIQRRNRSFTTFHRAAAGMQPKSSARDVLGGGPSRALSTGVTATEV
jgi:hypothetical protein